MNLDAVIFDLDGTLIDSMGVWADVDVEFLSKRNIKPPKDIFSNIDSGNSFAEVAQYFKKKFKLNDTIEDIMNEWTDMVSTHYEKRIKLKNGVRDLLNYLVSKNIKLGVGTSNNKVLTRKVLVSNHIYDLFDVIITGCQAERGKPHPEIFLKVAESLKVSPDKCLVIEDVLVGVKAAKAAGMKVCAIEDIHSLNDKEEIKKIADFFADDFNLILEIVKKISE